MSSNLSARSILSRRCLLFTLAAGFIALAASAQPTPKTPCVSSIYFSTVSSNRDVIRNEFIKDITEALSHSPCNVVAEQSNDIISSYKKMDYVKDENVRALVTGNLAFFEAGNEKLVAIDVALEFYPLGAPQAKRSSFSFTIIDDYSALVEYAANIALQIACIVDGKPRKKQIYAYCFRDLTLANEMRSGRSRVSVMDLPYELTSALRSKGLDKEYELSSIESARFEEECVKSYSQRRIETTARLYTYLIYGRIEENSQGGQINVYIEIYYSDKGRLPHPLGRLTVEEAKLAQGVAEYIWKNWDRSK